MAENMEKAECPEKEAPKEGAKGLNFVEQIVADDLAAGKNGGRLNTRFPPEPNGYLHIGHAKAICMDFGVAEKFGGTCNLRFDDTNPTKEDTEYVDAIRDDIHWLGFDWGDREYYASDYFPRLYDLAVKMIKEGKAYVDDQTSEQIAAQKEDLESDMTELVAMQDDMKKKQANVSSLINTTKANLAQTQEDLADAQSNVADLEDKINQMVEYEKQLEIQKAKEDAARLAAIKEQEKEDTSTVVYVPTDSDQYLLGAIIQCEAGGESYDGKLAVGSVVINRVKSSYFPNSVSGVIYQSGQFSPVASGRLAYRLEAGVDGSCLQAAQDVLNGNITVGCLYFRQNNGIIQGTVIGNHVFY